MTRDDQWAVIVSALSGRLLAAEVRLGRQSAEAHAALKQAADVAAEALNLAKVWRERYESLAGGTP
jgi:hypothetical protein